MSMSVKAASSSSDVEEAQRPPEPLGHVQRDVGALRDLGLGQSVVGRHQHPVDDQEVEDIVFDGLVDLLVGAAEIEEQEAHPGQGLDPGDVDVGVLPTVSDGSRGHAVHPRWHAPRGV